MKDTLFHLAFPTYDMAATKRFYVDGLGCTLGRESSHAVTFGLAGHQLVAHLMTEPLPPQQGIYPHHFGLTFFFFFSWQKFLQHAHAKKWSVYQQPRVRFHGAGAFMKIPPGISLSSSTISMSRRSSANESVVRSAIPLSRPSRMLSRLPAPRRFRLRLR